MQNLLVIFGGDSVESDVSIITATLAMESVDVNRYKVFPVYIRDGKWWWVDKNKACDMSTYIHRDSKSMREVALINGELYSKFCCVWRKICKVHLALLSTHGGFGENGSLQGLLDMNRIPYTSCGVLGASISMDKDITHRIAKDLDVHTVDYRVIDSEVSEGKIEQIFEDLGCNVVIKPNSLGSSIGITQVKDIKHLHFAIGEALRYDDKVLIERCVDNLVELNCAAVDSVNGLIVSKIDIVSPHCGIYGFDEKYIDNSVSTQKPSIDNEILEQVRAWTGKVYKSLGLRGVVRMDYLCDSESGEVYLNEINSIPGSLAYYLFDNTKMDMTDLINIMLDKAIYDEKEREKLVTRFSSSILAVNANRGGKRQQKIHK